MASSSKTITIKKPTAKQLEKFAKSGAQGCPVCKAGEHYISVTPPENEDGVVIQCAECTVCHSTWNECFYRGDISELELGTPRV